MSINCAENEHVVEVESEPAKVSDRLNSKNWSAKYFVKTSIVGGVMAPMYL